MLELSRKANECIRINRDIEIVVLKIIGNCVKIGIKAPKEISVVRTELCQTSKCDPANLAPQPFADMARTCVVIAAVDHASEELLHQFGERRRTWNLPGAVQAICVSAMAPLILAERFAG